MLSATNDGNGDELNGDIDDEDMKDGEMGFDDGSAQVRNIRDPGQPTAQEHLEHMTTHRPYRSWCKFCVTGRGVNAPHRRSDAQDDLEGVPHVSMDSWFLGEKEPEERVSRVLVIRERRHKTTWAMLVPRNRTEFPWIAKRAAKFIDQLGHNRVTLRCDNVPAIEALAREIAQVRQGGSQTFSGESASGRKSVQREHRTCGGPRCWPGQDTEGCTGAPHRGQSPARRKDTVLVGGVCGVLDEQVRHRQGQKDTAAKTTRAKRQHTDPGVWRQDPVRARQTSERRKVGPAVPPVHQAGTGDQDKVGEHQEGTRAGEMGR